MQFWKQRYIGEPIVEIIVKIKDVKINVQNILNKFVKNDTIVSFKELSTLPIKTIMEIIPSIPGAIQTQQLESTSEYKLLFRVTMKKGYKWSRHKHDCDEVIVMREGRIKDDITEKELTKGGFLFIPKLRSHTIEALEDSEFYVEFQKDL